MTEDRTVAIDYARSQKQRNLDNLVALLKIPSVSTDP